jgi:hypothetical protein
MGPNRVPAAYHLAILRNLGAKARDPIGRLAGLHEEFHPTAIGDAVLGLNPAP